MIPEHLMYRFGTEIPFEEVCTAAYDGKRVAVFCSDRKTLRAAMDIFCNRIQGENFLVNYSSEMISYNQGAIVFFLFDVAPERIQVYETDHHYFIRSKG